jgi:hypothetical protein
MDVQPTMGIGISVHVRMQMNLKIETSSILSAVPQSAKEPFLLPIMWFEDAIEKIPEGPMLQNFYGRLLRMFVIS